ncbi:hypothetical protein O77CONTIG1_04085 [Leptolyngbya sp. O-77]|nr:hypothetical protein O77CONTIG1_04085 [Leptolyngbya sp. O-77]
MLPTLVLQDGIFQKPIRDRQFWDLAGLNLDLPSAVL